jgi:hypothetical protein
VDACGSCRRGARGIGGEALSEWLRCMGVGSEGQSVVSAGGVLGQAQVMLTYADVC